MACATDKLIHGLDAVTGFLQAKEQFDLNAFLPSHGEYSDLSYEDLAIVRDKLLKLVEKDGAEGLKLREEDLILCKTELTDTEWYLAEINKIYAMEIEVIYYS